MRLATYFLVWWAVLFGIWIVLVDTLAHPEYVAGPAAAGLAAIAALAIRRRAGASPAPPLRLPCRPLPTGGE